MLEFNKLYKILNEYRTSKHQFSNMSLKQAYYESYEIFKDLGFTTASTFAIWDFIYRLLPDSIKTPEVKLLKQKSGGTNLRPVVVNLINNNMVKIDLNDLKSKMVDRELIQQYLKRNDYGNRGMGLLKGLTKQSKRDITQDY